MAICAECVRLTPSSSFDSMMRTRACVASLLDITSQGQVNTVSQEIMATINTRGSRALYSVPRLFFATKSARALLFLGRLKTIFNRSHFEFTYIVIPRQFVRLRIGFDVTFEVDAVAFLDVIWI